MNYTNVEGMNEHGSKPMWVASQLNGREYTAAGQAGGALQTMAVLQAYQVDLLKDLNDGQGLYPEVVSELSQTTDLALWVTKYTAPLQICTSNLWEVEHRQSYLSSEEE